MAHQRSLGDSNEIALKYCPLGNIRLDRITGNLWAASHPGDYRFSACAILRVTNRGENLPRNASALFLNPEIAIVLLF